MTGSQLFNAIMDALGGDRPGHVAVEASLSEVPEGFDQFRGAHILLVEDNEINQQVATDLLEGEGFFIRVAENGSRALDILENPNGEKPVDIVLMDLQMPVMDGYTATKKIKALEKFSDLPVIAMTADAMAGVWERVKASGMDDYISKPIDPGKLFRILARWIRPGKRSCPTDSNRPGRAGQMRRTDFPSCRV